MCGGSRLSNHTEGAIVTEVGGYAVFLAGVACGQGLCLREIAKSPAYAVLNWTYAKVSYSIRN